MTAPQHLAWDAARTAPTWRAAWSDRTAALMAALCEAAYLPRPAVEAAVAPSGLRVAAMQGRWLLAVSPDLAALVWRGTEDAADWRIDLDAPLTAWAGAAASVRVHRGFLRAYLDDRLDVLAAVAAHVPADLGLYVTGHSLGGALAQIATADLDRDTLAACYTFGAPRVATLAFDRAIKAPHYRVVNGFDLVPGVPAPWFLGYRHSGDPRLLTGDGQEAYRRDRSLLSRFVVDLMGLVGAAFTGKLPPVADHMIELYRARLDEIADARAPVTAPKGD